MARFRSGLANTPAIAPPAEQLSGKDDSELIHRGIEEALNSYFASIEEGER